MELNEIINTFNGREVKLTKKIEILLSLQKEFGLQFQTYDDILEKLKEKNETAKIMKDFIYKKIKDYLIECRNCSLCFAECHTQKVAGDGNFSSPIVLIGEGPGEEEDKLGKPFVGRAGQLLNTLLSKFNVDRNRIYITNVVKCRPPKNRTPYVNEVKACSEILNLELEFISPRVIITLGSTPLKFFRPEQSITKMRGIWIKEKNYWIMPTYHPAYILRQRGERLETTKKEIYSDFKNAFLKLKELLN
ncbi:uracil-DNA glycosylase [Thermovenabulum sp.]|uniref:uracil-DNA glycosylase n=1 Tax=Thermovenabulum sp. TaxID=3100335 RepID=UPI003C7DBEB3